MAQIDGTDNWFSPYHNVLNGNVVSKGVITFSNTFVLTRNPDYKVNLAKGSNATYPYQKAHLKHWTAAKYYSQTQVASSKVISTAVSHLPSYITPRSFVPAEDAVALDRFKRAIRKQSEDFRLLVPLGEAKDLHRTVAGMIKFTDSFLSTLLRAKRALRRPSDYRKFASNAWLTYSFGISPTVRDTQELGKSIAAFLGRQQRTVVIRRGYTYDRLGGTVVTSSPSVAFGFSTPDIKYHVHARRSVHYVGGFSFKVTAANNYEWFNHLNVTPDQIPSTAWELLGLSWIIDYFANVGDFIDDVFTCQPLKAKYLVKTIVERVQGDYCWRLQPPDLSSGIISLGSSSNPGTIRYTTVNRSSLAALPATSLRFRTASDVGNAKYALGRILNLAALLGSRK